MRILQWSTRLGGLKDVIERITAGTGDRSRGPYAAWRFVASDLGNSIVKTSHS